ERAVEFQNRIEEEKIARAELQEKLREAEMGIGGKRGELDKAREYKSRLEVAAAEATMRLQHVYDHLNNEYALAADQVEREPDPDFKGAEPPAQEVLEERVNQLSAQINALGPVNMVAIEECRELEERYQKEKAQEADLLSAKEQILELIKNLNEKSSSLFRATFAQADENFRRMFSKLFNGGEARLVLLENAEDPLECGIDIIARPPGKRPQSVTLLSGGERTMTAVALLFAIFMIKPAPFCMLDELDAALDDANIGRFVDALKEFLDRSQFLIITHNQHTIAGSDLVYGVSQQEKGVSRILSMKLAEIGVKDVPDVK
ncbi:MAG: AAA family ATPase, partial [Kiritimatiellae bacterium]|nr:AAA family ATPase [Kiritimatiellia bacterium]